MRKMALYVFNGDPMCFIHVLLNTLEFKENGDDVRIVVEGAATALVPKLAMPDNPLHSLWNKVKDAGLVDGVCKACAGKMDAKDAAVEQGLPLLDDMAGHPGMARYMNDGFEILTF